MSMRRLAEAERGPKVGPDSRGWPSDFTSTSVDSELSRRVRTLSCAEAIGPTQAPAEAIGSTHAPAEAIGPTEALDEPWSPSTSAACQTMSGHPASYGDVRQHEPNMGQANFEPSRDVTAEHVGMASRFGRDRKTGNDGGSSRNKNTCTRQSTADFGRTIVRGTGGDAALTGVRSRESGVRNRESGVRNRESGVRNRESGVRSRESGVIDAIHIEATIRMGLFGELSSGSATADPTDERPYAATNNNAAPPPPTTSTDRSAQNIRCFSEGGSRIIRGRSGGGGGGVGGYTESGDAICNRSLRNKPPTLTPVSPDIQPRGATNVGGIYYSTSATTTSETISTNARSNCPGSGPPAYAHDDTCIPHSFHEYEDVVRSVEPPAGSGSRRFSDPFGSPLLTTSPIWRFDKRASLTTATAPADTRHGIRNDRFVDANSVSEKLLFESNRANEVDRARVSSCRLAGGGMGPASYAGPPAEEVGNVGPISDLLGGAESATAGDDGNVNNELAIQQYDLIEEIARRRRSTLSNGRHAPPPPITWKGRLPQKGDTNGRILSKKVFVGGLSCDMNSQCLLNAFSPFGVERVEWCFRADKGFAYLIFRREAKVHELLDVCSRDAEGRYYFKIGTRRPYRDRQVQLIPWLVDDSEFCQRASQDGGGTVADPLHGSETVGAASSGSSSTFVRRGASAGGSACGASGGGGGGSGGRGAQMQAGRGTVFVGALHGEMTAKDLAIVMQSAFGDVLFVGLDTDKFKYPCGTARVTFVHPYSQARALVAGFISVQSNKFTKTLQIDPYLRDAFCAVCRRRPGPVFCRHYACFTYFCPPCFCSMHRLTLDAAGNPIVDRGHEPLTKNRVAKKLQTLAP